MVGVEREQVGRSNLNPNPLSGGMGVGFCYYLVYIDSGVGPVSIWGRGGARRRLLYGNLRVSSVWQEYVFGCKKKCGSLGWKGRAV